MSNNDLMQQFEEAKKLLRKGADGDKNAVKLAHEKLVKLREAAPADAVIEAYYGSSLALSARDAVQPLDKADMAQEGLTVLARAVSMNPNQKEIRMLRAYVCLKLPESYFHCSDTAIHDLTFLLDGYRENPRYLTQQQVADIVEHLAEAYRNIGKPFDAKAAVQRRGATESKKK